MKKPINVLVLPAGIENGLEIIKSLQGCKGINLFGASSPGVNHSSYVFKSVNVVGDVREKEWINDLNVTIKKHDIDLVYPANSEVIDYLSPNREKIKANVLLPSKEIIELTRSKKATIYSLKESIPVPKVFSSLNEIDIFPVFAKPDKGYGSQGAAVIADREQASKVNFDIYIVQENLVGKEYTVDCFSDESGKLIFSGARERLRIRMGTSMHAESVSDDLEELLREYAVKILEKIQISGAWFFQVKEDSLGVLKLLEIDVRIAGTMCYHRVKGINFPLLSILQFNGASVKTLINTMPVTLDRCLKNRFRLDYEYDMVYVDLDDTLIIHDRLNIELISFLFQCINQKKKLILISKFLSEDISTYLKKWRVLELFDDIIWLPESDSKALYIPHGRAIFIDDSFSQRLEVSKICGIPTFDPSMVEALLDDRI
jgi:carbamoyl-phosphate synthase large subunit